MQKFAMFASFHRMCLNAKRALPFAESPTIETETTETIIATSVKSELPAEAEDAATTEIPIKSAITESTPAVAELKGKRLPNPKDNGYVSIWH